MPASVPKKDLLNKAADNQLMRKEEHNPMHKAEKKYQVGTVADEEEAKQRKLKGILNKLTPQNFGKLLEQVKSVNVDNGVTLSGVVSQIFDKALMEPTLGEMYGDLCFHLSGALPDFIENGEKISFRRLFLNKCQEEFERKEEETSRVAEEGQTEEEKEEKRLSVRRRMLCNIRLIGELYKKNMLTEGNMHTCIRKLLGYDQEDPHEENIEALCKLMSTIGVMFDHHRAKVHMDAYFKRMKMLSCKQELSSRVRFMLINVIDLRRNKWQERKKENASTRGKKKIKEILQKADAQGTTSDLYNAYKGPEEKKDLAMPSESSYVINDVSNQKLAPATPQAVAEATLDAESVKNEAGKWADKAGSSDEVRDTEKKYSRDFLLNFADSFTTLPQGFDISPDFANALFANNMGAYHHEHDSYLTPGNVMDRRGSNGRRSDRRPSNQGSLPAGFGGNLTWSRRKLRSPKKSSYAETYYV